MTDSSNDRNSESVISSTRRELLKLAGVGVSAGPGMLLSSGTVSAATESTGDVVLDQDFEDLSVGAYPDGWEKDGNQSQGVTDNFASSGSKSLELRGSHGGCWQAVANAPLKFPDEGQLEISFAFRPTTNGSFGCHPYRGNVDARTDAGSWGAGDGISLLSFEPDGTVSAHGETVSEYSVDSWNTVQYSYTRKKTDSGERVTVEVTVNGNTAKFERKPRDFEDQIKYLTFRSGDFTTQIDNIRATKSATGYTITQGSQKYNVTPLTTGETVEEFYNYANAEAHTSTNLERSQTSLLFLWNGPNGLSLVAIHGKSGSSGGAVSFDISGLPTNQGEWVVQDDSSDFDSSTDASPDWSWSYENTDGGAWRGGLSDGFKLTIKPAFNDAAAKEPLSQGEITDWYFLTGDADDPEKIPLDKDQEVTIQAGAAEKSKLDDLIGRKRMLIDDIENATTPALGDNEASTKIDLEAKTLLEDIKEDNLKAEIEQYRRALHRMIATEEVTKSATQTTTGDNSPTNTIIRDLYSFVTGAVVELLPEAAEGIVGRVTSSLADDVASKMDDVASSLIGKGVVPDSTLKTITGKLDELKQSQSSTLKTWTNNHPDKARQIVGTAADQGLNGVNNVADGLVADLNDKRSIQDKIEELYFEGYYFGSDWPAVNVPNPAQLEIPEADFSYDVPNESLPSLLQGIPPDEISFSTSDIDAQLPEAPNLGNTADLLEQIHELATVGGVDTTIDERMNYIEENIDDLEAQDVDDREELSDILSEGIGEIGEIVNDLIAALEEFAGIISKAGNKIGLIALGFAALGAALSYTGIGGATALSVAGLLATTAGVLGLINLAVDSVQIAAGQSYLTFTNYSHHVGTYLLGETDLSGVEL